MAFHRAVALDFGTEETRIAIPGKGMVLTEPTVAAVQREGGSLIAVGQAAREALGRTPETLIALRPVEEGRLSNITGAESLLRAFWKQVRPGFHPKLALAVPIGATEVERQALAALGSRFGCCAVWLIESSLAAAIGAESEGQGTRGGMLAVIGGGVTEAAVLSLGGIAASACLFRGGDAFDKALIRFVRRKQGVLLGFRTAQMVKECIGRVGETTEVGESLTVKGRCLRTGLPKDVTITQRETAEAYVPAVEEVLELLVDVLEQTPPELSGDVAETGIVLTGGGAKLRGLDAVISERLGIAARVAEEPETCVIRGLEVLAGRRKWPHR